MGLNRGIWFCQMLIVGFAGADSVVQSKYECIIGLSGVRQVYYECFISKSTHIKWALSRGYKRLLACYRPGPGTTTRPYFVTWGISLLSYLYCIYYIQVYIMCYMVIFYLFFSLFMYCIYVNSTPQTTCVSILLQSQIHPKVVCKKSLLAIRPPIVTPYYIYTILL